jgi:hypothetical protein
MLNRKELKARMEEEKNILLFYVRYEKEIIEMTSEREWETEVDECLDILIEICRLLKQ